MITDGPYVETKEFLGGFAIVDVPDDETAKMWAGKIAEACGWPHEVRRFKPQPRAEDSADDGEVAWVSNRGGWTSRHGTSNALRGPDHPSGQWAT